MAIETALWRVAEVPTRLSASSLATEAQLEQMICAVPQLLSEEWMIVGKQEQTSSAGRVDLIAMAPDASLILIELKRDRTPRDVVAQALDYASWLETLAAQDVDAMYRRFRPGANLARDYQQKFGSDLDESSLNQSHQIVVVASALDASTERIVEYLRSRDVPINVLFFQVFSNGGEKILSRSWLADPTQTQLLASGAASAPMEPWNGEYYCSFGEDAERSWEDAREFGFFSAGGGRWYTRTLSYLKPNDRIWVKIPGRGFVGVGRVTGPAVDAKDLLVSTPSGLELLSKASKRANYLRQWDEDEKREVAVSVQWIQTVPASEAFTELGLFGNQNSVCQPVSAKWRSTVDRLKVAFPEYDSQ